MYGQAALPRRDWMTHVAGNILIVEDDTALAETLSRALGMRGFAVTTRASGLEALTLLESQDFDVVITDLHMDNMDGLVFCERIAQSRPDVPVIVITAFGTMDTAIAAMRAGAFDFVTKPFEVEMLRLAVARAVQHRTLNDEVKRLRREVSGARGSDTMVGSSPALRTIRELIDRLSDSDATLLITGASGTGKELVAQAVHRCSRHSAGPFVAINCAAMPEALLESELFGHVKGAFTDARAPRQGLFLKANGGTLFLDEIGEMPLGMQPKLLRALQEKVVRPVGSDGEVPYEARIITATNRDLETEVDTRRFREDLFYRINVVRIDVPPLKARGNDVLFLAQHFIRVFAEKTGKEVNGLSATCADKLIGYTWPGNVRELQNCIERAVALTRFDELSVDDLPEKIRGYRQSNTATLGFDDRDIVTMDEMERRYALRVLKQLDGNKTLTAQRLGVDRRTLYRKMDRWMNGAQPVNGESRKSEVLSE